MTERGETAPDPGARGDPYDEVPYGGSAVPSSHPDVLFLVGRRHGLSPASPSGARVLELGCAEGANLLPMAYRREGARFVGLDASAGQLEIAREAKDRLGLDNLELIHARIEDVDPADLGCFDYVICHGVLSWVAPPVRERLWSLISNVLAPEGVALVSFNCTPGWSIRREIRHAMLARTANAPKSPERLDRAAELLALLAGSPASAMPYGALLAQEAGRVLERSGAYLEHEYLAAHNQTFRYGEVAGAATEHGLAPLEELGRAVPDRRSEDELRERLLRFVGDPVEAEELAETMLFRAFRMMTFTHESSLASGDRAPLGSFVEALGWAGRVSPMARRPSLDPEVNEEFETEEGLSIASEDPLLKAALIELARVWPRSLTWPELSERACALLSVRRVPESHFGANRLTTLGHDLLELARLGHVRVTSEPVQAVQTSEAPRVDALTRWEASRRFNVTGPYHQVVVLDPLTRALIRVLDGSRHKAELLAIAKELVTSATVVLRDDAADPLDETARDEALPELVRHSIALLADAGLLAS